MWVSFGLVGANLTKPACQQTPMCERQCGGCEAIHEKLMHPSFAVASVQHRSSAVNQIPHLSMHLLGVREITPIPCLVCFKLGLKH